MSGTPVWTNPEEDEAQPRRAFVRSLIGDTDPDDPQVSDALIAPYLTKYADDDECGYRLCLFLVGKYAREAASQLGPLKEAAQERVENYTSLADQLYRAWKGLPPEGAPSGGDATGKRFAGALALDNGVNVPSFFTRQLPY